MKNRTPEEADYGNNLLRVNMKLVDSMRHSLPWRHFRLPVEIADLVLLAANPLEDIKNTQKIDAVILNGKLIAKESLQ
jgi:hypothetical protein